LKPKDEDSLEGEIPRNVVKNNAEGDAFEEVEKAEYDPVCEPLNIILGSGRLQCLE